MTNAVASISTGVENQSIEKDEPIERRHYALHFE